MTCPFPHHSLALPTSLSNINLNVIIDFFPPSSSSSSTTTIVAASLAGAGGALALYLLHRRLTNDKNILPLPPGPPGWPIIGNLLDMPREKEWLTYAEWGKKYGTTGITSLSLPRSTHLILIHSSSLLPSLDRLGASLSSRPRLEMGGQLLGYVDTLVLLPYGPRFRSYRKHFAAFLGPGGASSSTTTGKLSITHHRDDDVVRNSRGGVETEWKERVMRRETLRFLKRVLGNSDVGGGGEAAGDRLLGDLRTLAGGIILSLTYGITVLEPSYSHSHPHLPSSPTAPPAHHADPFISLIEHANSNFNASTLPGAFLVDILPSLSLLAHLPAPLRTLRDTLVPCLTGWARKAERWSEDTRKMVEVPFEWTRQRLAKGIAPPCFVADLLKDKDQDQDQDQDQNQNHRSDTLRTHLSNDQVRDIKFAASSMYGGGADTTVSAEYAFFLAMVLYPDVQKRAQAEIDALINNGHSHSHSHPLVEGEPTRLLTLTDRPKLPYVSALVSEVLRWNSVAPTGVPHLAVEDTVVGGYRVPQNSIVIANLWEMLHDPDTYPDPFTFSPERFLPPPLTTTSTSPSSPSSSSPSTASQPQPQRDPRTICFGFARRVCPGMHLADASLFLCIANTLAVLDISKASVLVPVKDDVNNINNNNEPGVVRMVEHVLEPTLESTSGIISYPKEFKCKISPRSSKAVELVSRLSAEFESSPSE